MEGRWRRTWRVLGAKTVQFAKESTVHGVPNIAAPKLHPTERIFWFIIIILATLGAIALALQNLGRYYANPTVVSLQKDFRNWFNAFPAATACFVNRVDEIAIDEYIIRTWGINESDVKYDYYRKFVEVVAHVSYETISALEEFRDDESLFGINLFDLVTKVHPELTGSLITFDTQRKVDWRLVMTEMGVCFSVNTKVAKYFAFRSPLLNASDPEEIQDESILHCHYLNGLCYARFDSDPLAPFKVYVHSYFDIAHATSEPTVDVKESQELELNFQMQETSADPSLRNLMPSQRKCRFDDEPVNSDLSAYSTSVCYISCRYRRLMRLCGCKPYFYHNFPGKECDLKGMLCVARHAKELMESPIKLGCNCPQPCHLITYLPQMPKITVWEYGYFDQRITFRWELLPPTTKYRRDILFGFEDLVVSIGGTLALFLGVSFISAFEILHNVIYLLCYIIYPGGNESNRMPDKKIYPTIERNTSVAKKLTKVTKLYKRKKPKFATRRIAHAWDGNVFFIDAPVSYYGSMDFKKRTKMEP